MNLKKNDDKLKAREMLSVKANKKIVQHHLAETTGKVVLLKDIHKHDVSHGERLLYRWKA